MNTKSVNPSSLAHVSSPSCADHNPATFLFLQGFRVKKIENGRVTLTRRIRRNGSVLILVVVLLVLMALLGTAYLATTRTDRYTSQQNQTNTQVDLLADGVKQIAISQIVRDLTNGDPAGFANGYRSLAVSGTLIPYRHHDTSTANAQDDDLYLAERLPSEDALGSFTPTAPYWPSISWSLKVPPAGTAYQFDNPYGNQLAVGATGTTTTGAMQIQDAVLQNKDYYRFEIGSRNVTITSGGTTQTLAIPTLIPRRASDGSIITSMYITAPASVTNPTDQVNYGFPAADADGDGIADSGLSLIPGGVFDGITYYAAMRVVDLSSTINVNTAWLPGYDYTVAGAPAPETTVDRHYLPTHIGLEPLLVGGSDAANVRNYHMNFANSAQHYFTSGNGYLEDGTVASGLAWITQGDAFYHTLGRRIDNPGYITYTSATNNVRMQAFDVTSNLSLASRFCIAGSGGGSSILESSSALQSSLVINNINTTSYTANNFANWYANNFTYDAFPNANTHPIRALLSTRNPVANTTPQIPVTAITEKYTVGAGAPDANRMPDYVTAQKPAPRVSLNTSTFGELWRGFYGVMSNAPTNANQLKSSIRITGSAAALTFPQMQVLRSSLAAANAESMRPDSPAANNPIKHTVTLSAGRTATVYGHKPQPYITEVFASNNVTTTYPGASGPNPRGYVCIKLYNPYNTPINMNNWVLTYADRANMGTGTAPVSATALYTFNQTLAPQQYMLIDNWTAAAGDPDGAQSRPTNSTGTPIIGLPATGTITASGKMQYYVQVNNLATILIGTGASPNRELVILRPADTVDATGTVVTAGATPEAPVDSFDFSGLVQGTIASVADWYYRRATAAGVADWQMVYPGPYADAPTPRFQGTNVTTVAAGSEAVIAGACFAPASVDAATASYTPTYVVQMASSANWPGIGTLAGTAFPFGGFARIGDVLQVPFAGSYRINTGANLDELNAITVDSTFAKDTTITPPAGPPATYVPEQIGRFCMVGDRGATPTMDFSPNTAGWHYHWASSLFDYFATVTNPNDDYTPAKPGVRSAAGGPGFVPNAVTSTSATANQHNEDSVPIHGLINVNTAPWKVLAQVPFVPYTIMPGTSGGVAANDATRRQEVARINELIARAIVSDRMVNGAFNSLYDLNRVAAFRDPSTITAATINGTSWHAGPAFPATAADPAWLTWGVLSPDNVSGFEKDNIMVNRVSNLLTTRSDAFVVYLLIQGYQNAGTANAQVVAQRRLAFIVDRSNVTPTNSTPRITPVPVSQ